MSQSPLSLTLDPRLDASLAKGYEDWVRLLREIGLPRATAWVAQRAGAEVPKDDLRDHLQALLGAKDADETTFAQAELAELLEENDDELADLLWEQVLERGLDVDDPDLIFESSAHLSGIAEDLGELLAAAEYFIDFLNWRRNNGHISEPEMVQTAFDEVIRLAETDGEQKIAALFTYRQVQYTRVADSDADEATVGDWESDRAPYISWS
jgi:hypothetical protein